MIQSLAMPLLRRLDPERAHAIAMTALRLGLGGGTEAAPDPALRVEAMGLSFPNPIGLAAGFDKDGRALRPLRRLGFGFIEAGTVTPLPQPGNPRPRLFRLDEDGAVINRMGFNNRGVAALRRRLDRLGPVGPVGPVSPVSPVRMPLLGIPLGVNLGVNRHGADPVRDYPALVAALAPCADYLVINLSSPNTPGLRDLQEAAFIAALLAAIATVNTWRRPVLVKLAPDLAAARLAEIVEAVVEGGADGLIISNTTPARPHGLRSPWAGQAGGLSGRPLRQPSTAQLAAAARLARGRLTLVGCGGIEHAGDVLDKVRAGADLVQIYTGFVLHGPALLARLLADLSRLLHERGLHRISDAKGVP